MSELAWQLKASLYHRMAIRLLKALLKYGAHDPDCRMPCTCGWNAEKRAIQNLEISA